MPVLLCLLSRKATVMIVGEYRMKPLAKDHSSGLATTAVPAETIGSQGVCGSCGGLLAKKAGPSRDLSCLSLIRSLVRPSAQANYA